MLASIRKFWDIIHEESLHYNDHPELRAKASTSVIGGTSALVLVLYCCYQIVSLALRNTIDLRLSYLIPTAVVICAGPLAHLLLKRGCIGFLSRWGLICMHVLVIGLAFWLDCFAEPALCVVYVPLFLAVGPILLLQSTRTELIINTTTLVLYLIAAAWGMTPIEPSHALATAIVAYFLSLTALTSIATMRFTIATTSRKLERQETTMRIEQEQRRELQEALAAAQQASAAKTAFINNMSHDVLTPMNAIVGFNEHAAAHANDPDEVQKSTDHIDAASRQLLGFLTNVLDMTSHESGRESFQTSQFSLTELAKEVCGGFEAAAEKRHIKLKLEKLQVSDDVVSADRNRLSQVLNIMVDNAVKYIPEGRSISVGIKQGSRVSPKRVRYIFSVEDTGDGIPQEFLNDIFDPFSRERSTTEGGTPGAGLGLPLAKAMIEACGGSIRIESEPGAGTTASFILPLGVEAKSDYAEAAAGGAGGDLERRLRDEAKSLAGARILVVDDNLINREVASDLLTERGFEVITATNGKEAVAIFEASAEGFYAAIIMDIMMPEMDGLEATRRIRALNRPDAKSIPIIALSANAHSNSTDKAAEAGMDGFLSKPFQVESFMHILRSR